MNRDVRWIVTVPIVSSVVVALLVLLEQPCIAWWRSVILVLGWAYVVPVLGGLAGRWLVLKSGELGQVARRATKALAGMCIVLILFVTYFATALPTLGKAGVAIRGLGRWEVLALLLGIGIVTALPDGRRVERWARYRRGTPGSGTCGGGSPDG